VVFVKREIESWVRRAAIEALGPVGDTDPMVRAADPKFGDYQANLAMRLGKELGKKPREVAELIASALKQGAAAASIAETSVAGPGFVNLRLTSEFVDERLRQMFDDERLGVGKTASPETVVVDYSSPNLAKEMHIGHLRSTIIGDAICRTLEFRGDTVIRHNHLGDWGTQFGMLLEHLLDSGWDREADHGIGDLNQLYQQASNRFKADADFADRARRRVVALQAGDPESLSLWNQLIGESVRHMNSVYSLMGVQLEDDDIVPESFYNPRLAGVVAELKAAGILVESQGAGVTFPDGFKNKEGEPLPLIVQKKDGGYGYATTDLAAGRYRASELGAQRIIYVVDSRQSEHFQMVFWTLRKAGWVSEKVSLEHVSFGMILGKDRKPFRTRDGSNVRLGEVLDEAVARARAVIDEKNPELDAERRAEIADAVGVGAVKYADLSNERVKDYTFDYDRMLALEGNTSPYLQNAYVRIQSIFRKGCVDSRALSALTLRATEPTERTLALELFRLPDIIDGVASSLEPHRMCNYLYDLASAYHGFYERCRVLNTEQLEERDSRLALCHLVGRTLELGLGLLGLRVVSQM
jgi:arginyl-tRNA synthetase